MAPPPVNKHPAELICWPHLEGRRRCVRHAELAAVTCRAQVVIVPILPPRPTSTSQQQQQHSGGVVGGSSTTSQQQPAASLHKNTSQPAAEPQSQQQQHGGSTAQQAAAAVTAQSTGVYDYACSIQQQLSAANILALLDDRTNTTPGHKFHAWERLGVPMRIEVGSTELHTSSVVVALSPGMVQLLVTASAAGGDSGDSGSGVAALLAQYGAALPGATTAAVIGQQQQASPQQQCGQHTISVGAAACVYGTRPVKLRGVPAAVLTHVCQQLLVAAAAVRALHARALPHHSNSTMQQQPLLLPYGCCAKLHLWPSQLPSERPCVHHLQHLLGLALPCRCSTAAHIDLPTLLQEVRHQMCAGGATGDTQQLQFAAHPAPAAARRSRSRSNRSVAGTCVGSGSGTGDGGSSSSSGCSKRSQSRVGLFVWGLPSTLSVSAARVALTAAVQQLVEGQQSAGTAGVATENGSIISGTDGSSTGGANAANSQRDGNGSSSSNNTVGRFSSSAAADPAAAGFAGTVAAKGNTRRCLGWARINFSDVATAEAVMQLCGGSKLEVRLPERTSSAADSSSNTAAATAAAATDDSNSCSSGKRAHTAAMLAVSWCCGRADTLFPSLGYCCRRALRLDSVAAYSATDTPTAVSISALLAELALLARQQRVAAQQQQQQPGLQQQEEDSSLQQQHQKQQQQQAVAAPSGLSLTDLTACAGGNIAGFLQHFSAVTAVELDPDRAEDLLHNVQVFLGLHHSHHTITGNSSSSCCCSGGVVGVDASSSSSVQHGGTTAGDDGAPSQQQQQQQQEVNEHSTQHVRGEPAAAAAADDSCAPSASTPLPPPQQLGFSEQALPHLAVLRGLQQPPCTTHHDTHGGPLLAPQQSCCSCCAVVCGDAVQLAGQLQQQDVVFLDPPWGGPNYLQQQQDGGEQQPEGDTREEEQQQQQQQQHSNAAAPTASSSTASSSSTPAYTAAGISLSGVPLLDLCAQLVPKCSVLAVRVPTRCSDLRQFAQLLQQGSSVATSSSSGEVVEENGGGRATGVDNVVLKFDQSQSLTALLASYGRSTLVVIARVPAAGLLQHLRTTAGGMQTPLSLVGC